MNKDDKIFGSGGGAVTVTVGGNSGGGVANVTGGNAQGGGFATDPNLGGKGGGGGVGPGGIEYSNVKVGVADARGADDKINYVVLIACKDSTSHINNGEALTWADAYKAIGDQLEKWIDQDGLNVRNVTISATRDVVYQKRTGPV